MAVPDGQQALTQEGSMQATRPARAACMRKQTRLRPGFFIRATRSASEFAHHLGVGKCLRHIRPRRRGSRHVAGSQRLFKLLTGYRCRGMRAVRAPQFRDGTIELGNLFPRLCRPLDGAVARLLRPLDSLAQALDQALQRPITSDCTCNRTAHSGTGNGEKRQWVHVAGWWDARTPTVATRHAPRSPRTPLNVSNGRVDSVILPTTAGNLQRTQAVAELRAP